MNKRLPNRWLIAVGAIAIQICCGSLYSWSVFVKPLIASQPWTLVQVSAAFQIALAFIGIGAMLGGLLIGLIETIWSAYFSVEYKDVAAFSILIVVLIFLPTGLLGRPEVEKV